MTALTVLFHVALLVLVVTDLLDERADIMEHVSVGLMVVFLLVGFWFFRL